MHRKRGGYSSSIFESKREIKIFKKKFNWLKETMTSDYFVTYTDLRSRMNLQIQFKPISSDPDTRKALTKSFDTVHDNVQLLPRSQLSYQDVIVYRSDAGVCKHVCLVPNGDPLYVPGVN